MSITFCGSLASIPKDGSIYQITHIFMCPFNYERILKTTTRTKIDLCDSEEVTINVLKDLLTLFRAKANTTKIATLHQQSLQITYLCLYSESPMVPDENNIIECSCEVIASVDAATPK